MRYFSRLQKLQPTQPSSGFLPLQSLWLMLACLLGTTTLASHAIAQIIPDATLPNNSLVNSDGTNFQIDGGTQAGGNLFHSFRTFSVPTNSAAFFNNAADIQNIITRVTGGTLSNIDGILRANGAANLFLINPSGIVFGPNARLVIGGSFFASTASGIFFDDGTQFSAIDPQPTPLLTVNTPIGLQVGAAPGSIANQSQVRFPNQPGNPFSDRVIGLAVQPGKTISLVGGDVTLNHGYVTASGGRVELAAVRDGEWRFNRSQPATSTLSPVLSPPLGDIQLTQNAVVETSGTRGGEIYVQGANISVSNGSQLLANTAADGNGGGITLQANQSLLVDSSVISSSTIGSGRGGSINITAPQIDIMGSGISTILENLLSGDFTSASIKDGVFAVAGGMGAGGNITLNADQLRVGNRASILSTAIGSGDGGNLTVNAAQSMQLDGSSLMITGTAGKGDSGDISLNTNQLSVQGGSLIVASPSANAQGKGGNITANVRDFIDLGSVPAKRPVPGGLLTTTLGSSDAGDIIINTQRLIVRDGSQVSVASSGAGEGGSLTVNATDSVELSGLSADRVWLSGLFSTASLLEVRGQSGSSGAGPLTVNTQRLVVKDGGRVSAATGGEGAAGSLTINASDFVEVSGVGISRRTGIEPSALFSNSRGSGDAGGLKITTGQVRVQDGALIAVNGEGKGNAGDLEISASSIDLDQGTLSAATASGEGGNMILNADTLMLRNGSNISTEAGGTGNGGNLTINSETIIALEKSSITANAIQGRGGNIQINTQGIFISPDSAITASSALGVDGVVEVNRPDVDPSQGLVELPENVTDPTTQIVVGCAADRGNEFAITGRGGLPADPTQPLRGQAVWQDLRDLGSTQTVNPDISINPNMIAKTPDMPPLIEAQGWVTDANGIMELVAYPTIAAPHQTWYDPTHCQTQKEG